jgi:hypothetical protein
MVGNLLPGLPEFKADFLTNSSSVLVSDVHNSELDRSLNLEVIL